MYDKEFRCWNNEKCIPLTEQCDGQYDCADHSDEEQCKEISGVALAPPANIFNPDGTGNTTHFDTFRDQTICFILSSFFFQFPFVFL